MDRREFITSVAAVSAGACARGLAAEASFDPTEQSLAALQRALTAGVVSCEALTAAYLARIARFDQPASGYRSVLALNPNALLDVRASDAQRRARKVRGPLHGMPMLLKDNIETRDPLATTGGSWRWPARVVPPTPRSWHGCVPPARSCSARPT